MKLIKAFVTAAFFIIPLQVGAAREYIESGTLQCSTSATNTLKPIILFVNGIGNDLDSAEQSRSKIESLVRPQCVDCDFKKLYNQEDGLIDDVNELNLVGGWQLKAIDKSAIAQYDYFIKDTPAIFKTLADAGYLTYAGFALEELKADMLISLQAQRDLAKNGYNGATIRFYSPQSDGSSFAATLLAKNERLIDSSKTLVGNSTKRTRALEIYKVYLEANKEFIDLRFIAEYRRLVVATYFSDRNLYANDAKASGAMTKSVEGLTTLLNEYVLAGHKVIVVAHSQGNHVIDLAYSALRQDKSASFLKAIRVVGVASVSSSTPNNIYITWDEDHTVLTAHSFGGNSPLQANFADESPWYGYWGDAGKDHSLINVYLSNTLKGKYILPSNAQNTENFNTDTKNAGKIQVASDIFTNLVIGSIASAIAIPPSIVTNSVLTAQLRWEDYGDMDLHIIEPNNNHVYYSAKSGTFGHLDLDDRDGLGPEHYYADASAKCADLDGKSWKFSIHQFPSGGYKAAIHLLIKVGDSAFISRSFGLNQWPSGNLDVGFVKFTKPTTGIANTMLYEIKIIDPNG